MNEDIGCEWEGLKTDNPPDNGVMNAGRVGRVLLIIVLFLETENTDNIHCRVESS